VKQKATNDPRRFLAKKGPTGGPANLDIVVLKIEKRGELAAAAENLGLETVSVNAPWTMGMRRSPDRWIIVGRTESRSSAKGIRQEGQGLRIIPRNFGILEEIRNSIRL
jgi:hypothetical protein